MKLTIKIGLFIIPALLIIMTGCAFFETPDAPKNLTAAYNATEDMVELHWSEVDGASDYKVYRGASESSLTEIGDNEDGWYDDYDYDYLEPYYAVKAKNSAGTSDLSDVVLSDVPELDVHEPDNDIASATTLDQSIDNPTQKGSIRPASDVDFIKFHAEPCTGGVPCGYNIGIATVSCDLGYMKLELYDASGNLLESDDTGTSDDVARIGEWVPTVAGDYYVKISGNGTEAGYYRIFIIYWSD